MRHGSLFSGIGGFDLAAEWMGWENVFHCEWMEFPRKVLDYHFPDADSHIDICKTDFTKYANTIDILTGGFPCQPFSLAGKRKGTDDERYLWGEMLRAIQEIKPRFVIAENVFGITNIDGGLVFQKVCLDLEAEGYEVQPFIIPAAAKNAPHRRDRCWFIAYAIGKRWEREGKQPKRRNTQQFVGCVSEANASYSKCDGLEHGDEAGNIRSQETKTRSEGSEFTNDIEANGNGVSTDSKCIGRTEIRNDNGQFEKTQQGKCGEQQFSGANSTQSWWRNFPTQSPICSGDDGIPDKLDGITFPKWREQSIKGYGNAIVPQIAYQLFQIIQDL